MYRVIELGHIVAGPTAGLILAEMGFEVIKVEKPGTGDISRQLTDQSSGSFPYYNRMKKSLTLNLKSEKGKEILVKLIESADILIDNFSSDFLASMGLDFAKLRELNSRIIYVTIRGYRTEEGEGRKSLDYPIEIDSGIAYMTGLKDRPLRIGASIVDMFSASMAVIGIYDAILERERTGEGRMVDSSLFQNAMFMIGQHIATYQVTGSDLDPINERGFAWGIYDFFKTADSMKIFVAVTTDGQWKKFCDVMGIDGEYAGKYGTNSQRFGNRGTIIPKLQEMIEKLDSKQLEIMLKKSGVVYSFLRKPWDLLNDPYAVRFMNQSDFSGKKMHMPRVPVSEPHYEHAPGLGENNREVLKGLGYSDSEIQEIERDGVV